MNKTDRERIERRIRSMEETPYCPTDERIEEIKQRAFEEYDQFLRTNEKRNTRKNKNRSILRRVVAVAALAVCFLIGSFVYSVFAPVTIANANNFVRRASIWINNQLHLGITFSSPIDDTDSVIYNEDQLVQSIIELKNVANYPIIYIPESETLSIQNIDLNISSPEQKEISIWYSTVDNKTMVIRNIQMFERNAIGIDTKSLNLIETSIGTVYAWTDGAYSYAFSVSEGNIMYVTSSIPINDFEQYVRLLSFLS